MTYDHGAHRRSDAPDSELQGVLESARHWEDFYGQQELRWSGRPNPVLVDVATRRLPRTALDVGCGEGGDAIWLAQRGWHVTAVDISTTVLARAAATAERAGVGARIDWQRHDLARTFPAGSYDLVSAQYLHSPVEFPREDVLRAAARAVAPAGLLLIVGHAAAPPWAEHHHHEPDVHFATPDEVLESLALLPAQWRIDAAETSVRQATGPDGRAGMLSDSVVAATRLGMTAPD